MKTCIFFLMLLFTGLARADSIAWYGTLRQGLAEAQRSSRPILLIAAAPHCHNVSGIW
jgi:hypothetical protein